MKITVIGGGSTYTPELVNGFLARVDSLPIKELWLMDIDPERLEIVGGFAQRMVKAIEQDLLREYADPALTEPRKPDESRRRVLLHAGHAIDQLTLQRPRTDPRGQHPRQRGGQRLARGLGAGTARQSGQTGHPPTDD